MLTVVTIAAFAMLFAGIPMWMIFLLLAIGAMAWQGVAMDVVVQGLTGSIDKLVLLAVPGFIFAGGVMGQGGMSRRLVRWIAALIGRIPGGLPLTTIGAAELFGAISGSSPATVAALGKILYPALLDGGYSKRFTLGIITSSGAIAIIIPPSLSMILFGVMTNASIGKLFLAGFLPGIVVGICAAMYCIWHALRARIVSGRSWSASEIAASTRDVLWTLGAPALIFGGIYGGLMTPTEAAMAVSVYAVFVCVFVYGELTWAQVWGITRETAVLSAKIFVIVAASGVFSWVLTAENVPQKLVALFAHEQVSPVAILLVINFVLLLVGMFLDPNSAVILFTPLLWPLAEHAGVDLIHFGIIMTVNLAIGMFSPPFGLNLFVSCSIFKVSSAEVVAGLIPFFFTYFVALMIITYAPWLSLVLPRLVFGS